MRFQSSAPRKMNQWLVDSLTTLRRYDREDYDGQKALSYDIFEWFLARQVDGQRWTWHSFPAATRCRASTPACRTSCCKCIRSGTSRTSIFTWSACSSSRMPSGEPLRFFYEREQRGNSFRPGLRSRKPWKRCGRSLLSRSPRNPLYLEFLAKVDELDNIPEERRRHLPGELAEVISASVYPAYEQLIAYQDSTLARASSNDGVWRLPDGE